MKMQLAALLGQSRQPAAVRALALLQEPSAEVSPGPGEQSARDTLRIWETRFLGLTFAGRRAVGVHALLQRLNDLPPETPICMKNVETADRVAQVFYTVDPTRLLSVVEPPRKSEREKRLHRERFAEITSGAPTLR